MGVGYSKQEFQQPNLIMDFDFQLFKPNATPRVFTKRGPQSNLMHEDIAEEILLTIEQIIRSGDRYNKALYSKYYWCLCCCLIWSMPCWIFLPIAIVYGTVFVVALNYFQEYRFYAYLAIAGAILLTCFQCYCYCCSTKGVNKAAINWRNSIIQQINGKTEEWQCQWPQFSMTIIYPLTTHGRKGRIVMIRGIVRVTKGAPQIVHANMPLYSQYVQQPAAVQSELISLKPQQPQMGQHIHQRSATPVLVQNVNGQQMLVQGQKAIINGREVLLVEQPPQIQQQQQPPQPIQYQQPLPHQIPLSVPHQQPLQQQPEIALSTHSDIHYNNNNNNIASAPPAYNPNVNLPVAHSQDEGKADTLV